MAEGRYSIYGRRKALAVHRRRMQDLPPTPGVMSRLHSYLSPRMFYPLLAASALAMVLYGAQWVWGGWYGPRLHVNLALAWIPYLCALWAVAMRAWTKWRRWLLLLPLPIWLAFFPNAPYMVTDFMYLQRLTIDTWSQIGIFMSFALCGLYLAMASLYLMHTLVRGAFGSLLGWLAVLAALVASGVGIVIGRFLRWNSWELFTHPGALWHDLTFRQGEISQFAAPLAFAAVFSAMIAVFYFMFLATRRSVATPEELHADREELGAPTGAIAAGRVTPVDGPSPSVVGGLSPTGGDSTSPLPPQAGDVPTPSANGDRPAADHP
jgi:uncharacterized membrane protein